jgi:hypothetical protein
VRDRTVLGSELFEIALDALMWENRVVVGRSFELERMGSHH